MNYKKKHKVLKLLGNVLYKYGWYKQKMHERNCIEIIVDHDGILWLNEKHKEEGLDYRNFLS